MLQDVLCSSALYIKLCKSCGFQNQQLEKSECFTSFCVLIYQFVCTFTVVALLQRFVCKSVGYVFTECEFVCTFTVVALLQRFVCKSVEYVFTECEYGNLKVSYVDMP
jgi:hypothetical protein